MLTFTSSFFHILCRGCNIPADTPCGQLSHKAHTLTPWRPVLAAVWQARPCPCCKQPTMRPGTHPPCRHEMLRKKYHVVRKKNHVVRKIFYVASIFGEAAGRKNRPPWELSSMPWTLSSTAGTLSSTASLQCVTEHPHFLGDAQTSLPDTDNPAARPLRTVPRAPVHENEPTRGKMAVAGGFVGCVGVFLAEGAACAVGRAGGTRLRVPPARRCALAGRRQSWQCLSRWRSRADKRCWC